MHFAVVLRLLTDTPFELARYLFLNISINDQTVSFFQRLSQIFAGITR